MVSGRQKRAEQMSKAKKRVRIKALCTSQGIFKEKFGWGCRMFIDGTRNKVLAIRS